MKKTTTYFKHEGKVSELPTKVFKNQEEMSKYRAKHRALEKKKGMSKEQMKHIKEGNLGGFMRTYLK